MKYLFWVTIIIVISACSATGSIYQNIDAPSDGKSALYIYRPSVFQNSVILPAIILNDNEFILMKNGAYTSTIVNSGYHNLSILLSDRYEGNASIKILANPKIIRR